MSCLRTLLRRIWGRIDAPPAVDFDVEEVQPRTENGQAREAGAIDRSAPRGFRMAGALQSHADEDHDHTLWRREEGTAQRSRLFFRAPQW
jgi:hypothetical protein